MINKKHALFLSFLFVSGCGPQVVPQAKIPSEVTRHSNEQVNIAEQDDVLSDVAGENEDNPLGDNSSNDNYIRISFRVFSSDNSVDSDSFDDLFSNIVASLFSAEGDSGTDEGDEFRELRFTPEEEMLDNKDYSNEELTKSKEAYNKVVREFFVDILREEKISFSMDALESLKERVESANDSNKGNLVREVNGLFRAKKDNYIEWRERLLERLDGGFTYDNNVQLSTEHFRLFCNLGKECYEKPLIVLESNFNSLNNLLDNRLDRKVLSEKQE